MSSYEKDTPAPERAEAILFSNLERYAGLLVVFFLVLKLRLKGFAHKAVTFITKAKVTTTPAEFL